MQKNITDLIIFLLYLFLFLLFLFLIMNFFNIIIIFRETFINNFFVFNKSNFLNIYMLIIKYIYVYKIIINNFFDLLHQFIFYFIHLLYLLILQIKIYLKYFFYKIIYVKHIFALKTVFKIRGYSEFFLAFFCKPTIYRFFSFYVFFVSFFISLDWIEHAFESIDNTDSEFEIDFESAFTWDNDPLIGRNFFSIGQRLAMEKTSEGPDLYKINDFFYQSKKSKFNKYNREFLQGPEYLDLLDLFSTHESFHQVGSYEFFGPSFTVIFVSFETDFEFEFFFFQKFFSFIKIFVSKKFTTFIKNISLIFIFEFIVDSILYIFSYIFLLFKYIYNTYFKK